MPLTFEWDSRKARSNLAKHGVGFQEASTIFGDPLSLTIPDPEHSLSEKRYITVGRAFSGKLLVVVHTERGDNICIISAPADENVSFMKRSSNKSARKPMRNEYDFSQGERGKYARRYAQGTNVVVLEPDVAKVFSNSKSVNASLRKIIRQRATELAK
jgi:uncharacterized DUF497 family protein